jgi:hypothetical protein
MRLDPTACEFCNGKDGGVRCTEVRLDRMVCGNRVCEKHAYGSKGACPECHPNEVRAGQVA